MGLLALAVVRLKRALHVLTVPVSGSKAGMLGKRPNAVKKPSETGTGKQYMKVNHAGVSQHPLDVIIKIEVGDAHAPLFDRPMPADRFSFLRSEICMSDLLAGMPDTERSYLLQLLQIVEKVHFVRVVRPAEIAIRDLHAAVSDYLGKKDLRQ